MKSTKIPVILFLGFLFSVSGLAQQKEIYKLPSGPDGPGTFGAYYAHLKYDPVWDKNWRVGDHPDIVVRFDDGGHKFVFWRGTSYIPCWVTDNGIWYTNEFVERRGIHNENTEGCVEPMSDKQCRFSQVRIIESNDARVVIHWRYSPIDVQYEHAFTDPETGWFDWVDEYYVIYPNATGVRDITVRSSGLNKWIEYQEGIVVNQPGTLPDDNIEAGAISIANMEGEHITYFWDQNGGPVFDRNPDRANIVTVNLKSEKRPFALVPPPEKGNNMITSYGGHSRKSIFNWWDHWPVSQDASDGRSASSAARPSQSSLFHISLQKDPPIDCWGADGYHTIIQDRQLNWTAADWSTLNMDFDGEFDISDSVLIEFDYINLWLSGLRLIFSDDNGGSTEAILLNAKAQGLVMNDMEKRRFSRKFYMPDIRGEAALKAIREAMLDMEGNDEVQTMMLDNIRFTSYSDSENALAFTLDFDLPDGSRIEDLNLPEKAKWEPYMEEEQKIRKLMMHGMSGDPVEDLVPLAKSWTNPPELMLSGDGFENIGYDPAQMAYVLDRTSLTSQSLAFSLEAREEAPLVNPAFVIGNWGDKGITLMVDGKLLKDGEEFRAGYAASLSGTDLVVWVKMRSEKTTSFSMISTNN